MSSTWWKTWHIWTQHNWLLKEMRILYIYTNYYMYIYICLCTYYIYITHIYLLFSTRQIATIRMEIDRGVKAAVDFFFSLGVDVCTKGYKHEVVQTANIRSQVCWGWVWQTLRCHTPAIAFGLARKSKSKAFHCVFFFIFEFCQPNDRNNYCITT